MVSVIVPVYNVEEYISFCIQSILKQSYSNLQIILIDDGSTDSSGKICDYYSKHDKRCFVFHQDNHGLAQARNIGLKYAKGEYVLFIDSDDYIHPRMIEILYTEIQKGAYDYAMCLSCKTDKIERFLFKFSYESIVLNQEQVLQSMLGENDGLISRLDSHVVWGKLYKKNFIAKMLFKSIAAEDLHFNLRLTLNMYAALVVKFPFYYYFQRKDSIVHLPFGMNDINTLKTYSECYQLIPKEKKYYRDLCLKNLYWKIVDVLIAAYATSYKEQCWQVVKEILQQNHLFLLKCRLLSLKDKIKIAYLLLKYS